MYVSQDIGFLFDVVCVRDVQLGNFLSISISTNSIGLLSISTFINSTQAESYQYQLNLSCSDQLINSITTWIPKLLFFSQKLTFKAFIQWNSHQRFPEIKILAPDLTTQILLFLHLKSVFLDRWKWSLKQESDLKSKDLESVSESESLCVIK